MEEEENIIVGNKSIKVRKSSLAEQHLYHSSVNLPHLQSIQQLASVLEC